MGSNPIAHPRFQRLSHMKGIKQNKPSVDIVVCTYNDKRLTAQCLDSLLALSYPNYRIILVDDCSLDDTVAFLERNYPDITIIKNKKNLGPAKTRNVGIKLSKTEYIVTMDNDATLSPDWLSKMVKLMESDKKIGQAVGKILFLDNPKKIVAAGGSMYFRGKGYDIGQGELATKYNETRKVLYACTSSSIIRREILDYVRGFCDIFYHGYEDTDLSLRLNIAGYKVIYYPQAISYHLISKTVNKTIGRKRIYYAIRNRLLIIFRNYQFKSLIKYLPANLTFTIKDCLRYPERIIPVLLSWLWLIFHLPSIIRQRRKINKYRKIKDNQLLFNQK